MSMDEFKDDGEKDGEGRSCEERGKEDKKEE
jgi:hypothetical protein